MTRTPLSLALLLPFALAAAACSSASKKKPADVEAEAGSSASPVRPSALSRAQAHTRSKQVARVTYTLWFGLDEAQDDFEGRAVINFELRPKAADFSKTLWLDFEEGKIGSISLNGQPIAVGAGSKEGVYDGHRIAFRTADLRAGSNRVEIAFTHAFSKSGAGLHRFKDPVDGEVYLYSNFEPYDAHRMFPCFDQPDLKASYELTVEAPPEWQVVSNTPERAVSTVDGRKSWQFPPSPVFSTYVFALHAGPYVEWKDDAEGIPIRLFARKSIEDYVEADSEEWLEVTKQGLEWYGTYFGYPYPYAKYDQVIVPDFNAGAMENVAAVTFSERYVYRSKVTRDRRRGRADTILHEMAHMWFGDLVTMRWWNGLWLNESFATFMAAKAVDEATKFKGSWQDFFADTKSWAYWEDQLVTTHPIEGPVFDTDMAGTHFDGITYGKGAATLKQLAFTLGDDDFREGLQRYFQKYALRNTTVNDFVRMLQEASGKNLGPWQKSWLQASGVNTVRADWACAEGKLSRFALVQSVPEQGAKELRPHRTQVALYGTKGGKLKPLKTATVLYAGETTAVAELVGAPCPEFVYPNHGDFDYAKVELDETSLETAREKLARFEEPFARQMVWASLWQMVVDGKLKAQDYARTVLSQGVSETDTQVLAYILGKLADPDGDDASVAKFLVGPMRAEHLARVEKVARERLARAPAGSDVQLIWYRVFLAAASSPEALRYAQALLAGKAKVPGLRFSGPPGQERRWELIGTLARNGVEGASALIQAELEADNTDMGQKEAISAEASIPAAASKQAWLDHVMKQDLPYPKLREAMGSLHLLGQDELARIAVEPYFAMIPKLGSTPGMDEEFSHHFTGAMYPAFCDPAIVERAAATLAAHPELPAFVVKSLKVAKQEDERCIRARSKAVER